MKILFVTTISNTVNSFLIPHIRQLVGYGHELGIACNVIQEINEDLTKIGCNVHNVEFQRDPLRKENIQAYKRIRQIVMQEGYELVHVHTPVASFLTRLSCRKIKGLKVLYTAHGFHFFRGAPKKFWFIYYILEKLAARWTDGIITMNSEDYENAKNFKLRKPNSVYQVPGVGLDLHRFIPQNIEDKRLLRMEYGINMDDFLITYVGELSYRKHQDLLIRAIGLLSEKHPYIKLLLVGDGDLEGQYRELVTHLNLENQITFLGYRTDVSNLMKFSDVVASTSRQEGLPVNIMEAMATGLPLVVTNCRGNRDLVTHKENGIVIEVDDVRGCAEAIELLYHSQNLRIKFGLKNIELINQYSLKNVISEMEDIYEEYVHDQVISNVTVEELCTFDSKSIDYHGDI